MEPEEQWLRLIESKGSQAVVPPPALTAADLARLRAGWLQGGELKAFLGRCITFNASRPESIAGKPLSVTAIFFGYFDPKTGKYEWLTPDQVCPPAPRKGQAGSDE